MKPDERCAFCARRATLTGEHIWSAWIGKLIGPKKITLKFGFADGTQNVWQKSSLNEKMNVACADCNNGWMSDLEAHAADILRDTIVESKPLSFSPRDIAIIAAFGFKSAVISDHARQNPLPFFYSAAQRRRFASTLAIPANVQVWIASRAIQGGLFNGHDLKTPRGRADGFHINVLTYSAGHFVMQVTGTRWTKSSRRRHNAAPRLTQSPDLDSCSIPIWPFSGAVNWPPPVHLRDDDVKAFTDRWKRLTLGAGFL